MILQKEYINQHYNIPKVKETLTGLKSGWWKLPNCPCEYARDLNESFENVVITKMRGEERGNTYEMKTLAIFYTFSLYDHCWMQMDK